MEIYQLRTFVTVATLGAVTKAANLLCITQPAVTGQIRALEQEIGVALFERKANKIFLTKAGESLLPEAQSLLSNFNKFKGLCGQLKGEISGRLILLTIDDPVLLRLGSTLTNLVAAYPLLNVVTCQCTAAETIADITNNLHLAGYYIGEVNSRVVIANELTKITYRIVGPKQWENKISRAGWREISKLPWISATRGTHISELSKSIFSSRGLTLNTVVEVDEINQISSIVSAGLGMTIMRDDIARLAASKDELTIWSGHEINAPLSLVYHSDQDSNPLLIALLSVIKTVWGN